MTTSNNRHQRMKEAIDRFIETLVVGLFLAPLLWFALLFVFALSAGLLMALGLYDTGSVVKD